MTGATEFGQLINSLSSQPPMKRRRSASQDLHGLRRLFELDELFLRVLGYLDAEDLANAQRVNKHWARLAVDPQLWKRLYLRELLVHLAN